MNPTQQISATPTAHNYFQNFSSGFVMRRPTPNVGEWALPTIDYEDMEKMHSEAQFMANFKELNTLVKSLDTVLSVRLFDANGVEVAKTQNVNIVMHIEDAYNRGLAYMFIEGIEAIYHRWEAQLLEFEAYKDVQPEHYAKVLNRIESITPLIATAFGNMDALRCFIENEYQERCWQLNDSKVQLDKILEAVSNIDLAFGHYNLPELVRLEA